MMNIQEMQDVLDEVTYKDGWLFELYEGEWEGPHIVIHVELPDATKPGQTATFVVHSMLPPMENEDQLLRWIAWRLGRIEVHEMREFFMYQGEVVYDPHAPLANEDRA